MQNLPQMRLLPLSILWDEVVIFATEAMFEIMQLKSTFQNCYLKKVKENMENGFWEFGRCQITFMNMPNGISDIEGSNTWLKIFLVQKSQGDLKRFLYDADFWLMLLFLLSWSYRLVDTRWTPFYKCLLSRRDFKVAQLSFTVYNIYRCAFK